MLINQLESFSNISEINLYHTGIDDDIDIYNWITNSSKPVDLNKGKFLLYNKVSVESPSSVNESDTIVERYNWHTLYPTNYWMLKPDYLTLNSELNTLNEHVKAHIKSIEWNRYQLLLQYQQQDFQLAVRIDAKAVADKYNSSPKQNFMFSASSQRYPEELSPNWDFVNRCMGARTSANLQTNMIGNAINGTSTLYLDEEADFFLQYKNGGAY